MGPTANGCKILEIVCQLGMTKCVTGGKKENSLKKRRIHLHGMPIHFVLVQIVFVHHKKTWLPFILDDKFL